MTIPLAALGRLNAHTRATGSYGQREAIYCYKTLAALVLVAKADAAVRFVRWTGKCDRCTDGRFTHFDWTDGYSVRCRDCSGTSRRVLHFTETTLPDGQAWHHPWEGRTGPGRDLARAALGMRMDDAGAWVDRHGAPIVWHEAAEWQPRRPGEKLQLDVLVEDLNAVEDWVETCSCAGEPYLRWPLERARHRLCRQKHRGIIGDPSHSYMLDLGRAPGGCFVCGTEQDLAGVTFGRMTELFHWSLPVCKAHRNAPHPKDPPPDAMITPAVRRWLDRHQAIEEVA